MLCVRLCLSFCHNQASLLYAGLAEALPTNGGLNSIKLLSTDYVSPERKHEPGKCLEKSEDLFAFGLVVLCMLRLCAGNALEHCTVKSWQEHLPSNHLLHAILSGCLQSKPGDRLDACQLRDMCKALRLSDAYLDQCVPSVAAHLVHLKSLALTMSHCQTELQFTIEEHEMSLSEVRKEREQLRKCVQALLEEEEVCDTSVPSASPLGQSSQQTMTASSGESAISETDTRNPLPGIAPTQWAEELMDNNANGTWYCSGQAKSAYEHTQRKPVHAEKKAKFRREFVGAVSTACAAQPPAANVQKEEARQQPECMQERRVSTVHSKLPPLHKLPEDKNKSVATATRHIAVPKAQQKQWAMPVAKSKARAVQRSNPAAKAITAAASRNREAVFGDNWWQQKRREEETTRRTIKWLSTRPSSTGSSTMNNVTEQKHKELLTDYMNSPSQTGRRFSASELGEKVPYTPDAFSPERSYRVRCLSDSSPKNSCSPRASLRFHDECSGRDVGQKDQSGVKAAGTIRAATGDIIGKSGTSETAAGTDKAFVETTSAADKMCTTENASVTRNTFVADNAGFTEKAFGKENASAVENASGKETAGAENEKKKMVHRESIMRRRALAKQKGIKDDSWWQK